MKRLYITTIIASLLLTSCYRDEKDLFENSAADRLHNAQASLSDYLTSADNGWEMVYFTNPYGMGYVFLMNFDKNGKVTIAAKNNTTTNSIYKEEDSLWDIDGTQSVTLSFKSYNSVFSAMASPGSDGVGYEGDYEFVVLEQSSSLIKLKGKKHSAYSYMRPIDKSIAWSDYYTPIDRLYNLVFEGNSGMEMNLMVDGKLKEVVVEQGGSLGDVALSDIIYPYVITRDGIEFYDKGILVKDSIYAKHFNVNDELTKLLCTDSNVNAYIESAYTPMGYFDFRMAHNYRWSISSSDNGSETQATYDLFNNNMKANNARLDYISIQTTDSVYVLHLRMKFDGAYFDGYVTLDKGLDGDNITFKYNSVDDVGKAILNYASNNDLDKGIEMIKQLIEGTFSLTSVTGSTLNIQQMYLTDITNPNRKIKVIVKK